MHTENPKVRNYYGAPLDKTEGAVAKRSRSGSTRREKQKEQFRIFEDESDCDRGQESATVERDDAGTGVVNEVVGGKENVAPDAIWLGRPISGDSLEEFQRVRPYEGT